MCFQYYEKKIYFYVNTYVRTYVHIYVPYTYVATYVIKAVVFVTCIATVGIVIDGLCYL